MKKSEEKTMNRIIEALRQDGENKIKEWFGEETTFNLVDKENAKLVEIFVTDEFYDNTYEGEREGLNYELYEFILAILDESDEEELDDLIYIIQDLYGIGCLDIDLLSSLENQQIE